MAHIYRVRTRKTASSQGRRRRGKSDDFPPPLRRARQICHKKVYQVVAAVSLRNFVRKLAASRAKPEPWLAADCYSSLNPGRTHPIIKVAIWLYAGMALASLRVVLLPAKRYRNGWL